jgi:hypothetical protein
MRLSLFSAFVLLICLDGLATAQPIADTLDDVEQKMADEERAAAIATAKKKAVAIELELKQAQKARDIPKVKQLRAQVDAARKDVGAIRKQSDEQFLGQAKAKRRAAAAEAEELQAIKKSGPVVIHRMGINYNVIHLPELTLVVENTEDVAVEAYEICAECFNKFDEAVSFPGHSNVFKGSSQNRISARETTKCSWQLSLQRETTKATVWVSRVKMADGQVLTFTKEDAQKKPYGIAKATLME